MPRINNEADFKAPVRELFTAALEVAEDLQIDSDDDALCQAEGQRFLLRMLTAALDWHVHHGDVDHPRLVPATGFYRKLFLDSPDTEYLRTDIDISGGREYRVRGVIPAGTIYVGFVLYGQGNRVANALHDSDFAGAEFEFVISARKDARARFSCPVLAAEGDENVVVVRQYFTDRLSQKPIRASVEMIDAPPKHHLEKIELANRVHKAHSTLQMTVRVTLMAAQIIRDKPANQLIRPEGDNRLFPTPDNRYSYINYDLGTDDALVVRGYAQPTSTCRYFSICLYNHYLESLDYNFFTIYKNHSSLKVNPDGSWEVVIARRLLAHSNAIETAGHRDGVVLFRELLPRGDVPPPRFDVELVKIAAARL